MPIYPVKVEGFEFYFVVLVLLATDTDQQFVVFRHVAGECLARLGEREVDGEDLSGTVLVEAEMVVSAWSGLYHGFELLLARCPAGRNEHSLSQFLVPFLVKLVISHRVVGTLEPIDTLSFRKWGLGRAGNPQPLARIAALGLAFVAAASVHSCTSPFLEAHDRAVAFGQGQRKSEIGVCRTVLTVFRRQTEVAVEGVLGVEVDTPALEIRIELLLCLPVLRLNLYRS